MYIWVTHLAMIVIVQGRKVAALIHPWFTMVSIVDV